MGYKWRRILNTPLSARWISRFLEQFSIWSKFFRLIIRRLSMNSFWENYECALLFSPQIHNWSKITIKDFPLSLRRYSTFGGIWGYSFRIISRSFSSSFKLLLRVLSDTFSDIALIRWILQLQIPSDSRESPSYACRRSAIMYNWIRYLQNLLFQYSPLSFYTFLKDSTLQIK